MTPSLRTIYDAAKEPYQGRIPNNFFQTWKTDIVDAEHFNLLKRYREQNPEFNFIFFDDAQMADYMKRVWGHHPISEIFAKTQFGAAKADIWRYCMLFDQGGVYLDIDAGLNFKLASIPRDVNELISYEHNSILRNASFEFPSDAWFLQNYNAVADRLEHAGRLVLNWGMVFAKGHPVMQNCINIICEHAHEYRGKKFGNMLNATIHFSGPYVLTRAVWRYVLETGMGVSQFGIDFNGLGLYKTVSAATDYAKDDTHYAKNDGRVLLAL